MRAAIVLALFTAFFAVADDQTPTGAKEMFFDPERKVSEASVGARAPSYDDTGRRIAQTRETPTQQNLGLSYWIELIRTAGKSGTEVAGDRTFQSGDRIRLHFRGNADGNIVIVQLGTSGTSSILFPDSKKGLAENRLKANRDHVLPSAAHWFRFDNKPGTEKLLVLFAKSQSELDHTFPTEPVMDDAETAALLRTVRQASGSKDLLIETETTESREVGTYAVHVSGKPIALEIALAHQ